MRRIRSGFTLIELLIVVAIIAILAAIAVPNFLEAQTRAKVSAAKGNIRTGKTGLMSFYVDHNRFPAAQPIFPTDPLGILASEQLVPLTTPVSYIGPSAFRDPFGAQKMYSFLQQIPAANPGVVDPNGTLDNGDYSLLYIHYPSTAVKFFDPRLNVPLAALVSVGPDLEDSLGGYAALPEDVFFMHFAYLPNASPISTIYDPTNGTVSIGDIAGFTNNTEPW
ncbi:prepilin-type N-terminal cleavage/methylation domain-containing protein [bacterium]|nr:prepilin-type N-terminal cleavage/methylation domain-containing protein [bacterium]